MLLSTIYFTEVAERVEYSVTGFSGKTQYREMRRLAGGEKKPQSGASGAAACILGLTAANMEYTILYYIISYYVILCYII